MDEPAENAASLSLEIVTGPIRGHLHDTVRRFLGIPYAAAPTGDLRFKPPQSPVPWSAIFEANDPGPCAPQKIRDFPCLDVSPLVGTGGLDGADYLRLNVWAPDSGEKLPVMVWVHGGGFVVGSKDATVSDGTAFARSGVICVALNYRLGIDGFLPIPGIPTNLGLRDILFGLAWVRDNIAAFGGDPDNVTLFGESAGAMATADLVTSPLGKGLFRRAIVQSGHGAMVREVSVAQRLVRRLAAKLRIAPTAAAFAGISPEAGWQAMEKLAKPFARIDLRDQQGYEPVFGISRFVPVYGDDVLPKKPHEALSVGAGSEIDVLIGTNAEEMNLYFVPTKVRDKAPGLLLRWLLGKSHPRPGPALRAYGWGRGAKPGRVFTDAMTDLVFRWPSRRFAEEHRGRTHVYEFDWRSPACGGGLGSAHGMELPFMFDTLATVTGPSGLAGEHPPQELADRIHRHWVQFATDGTLPWPEFRREARHVHRLAADQTIDEPVMPAATFLP